MLIKEYRIPLPLTVEEYRIAQLYMIAKKSKQESKGADSGSGVEILVNEPYSDGPGAGENKAGQFTHKVYHIGSHLPGWFKSLLPASALTVEERAWNAYPYTKTVFSCPFVEKFSLEIETYYLPDGGQTENVFNLTESELSTRLVDLIDVVRDQEQNYVADEDPTVFISDKTGRGPLDKDWLETYSADCLGQDMPTREGKAVMCAYKLCKVEFRYWGMQSKIERFIHDMALRNTMLRAHRQAWVWQDEWFGLTMDDIRDFERRTAEELKRKMRGEEELDSECETGEEPDSLGKSFSSIEYSSQEVPNIIPKASEMVQRKSLCLSENSATSGAVRRSRMSTDRLSRTSQQDTSLIEAIVRSGEAGADSDEEFFDCKELPEDLRSLTKWNSMELVPTVPDADSEYVTNLGSAEAHQANNESAFKELRRTVSCNQAQARQKHHPTIELSEILEPSCPTSLLILVVHGGSILDSFTEPAVRKSDVTTMRGAFESIMRQHFQHLVGRMVMKCVPCPNICEAALAVLSSLSPYAGTGSLTANDRLPISCVPVLAASDPSYQESVSAMISQANKIYQQFLESEDGFGFSGQVCVLADSVGSLMAYDGLCRTPAHTRADTSEGEEETSDQPRPARRSTSRSKHLLSVQSGDCPVTLSMEVSSLFMLGSPLPLVLAARQAAAPRLSFARPACSQVYNMFHPSHPVVARLEPLLVPACHQVPPVNIPRYGMFPLGDAAKLSLADLVQTHHGLLTSSGSRLTPSRGRRMSSESVQSGMFETQQAKTITEVTKLWWGNKRMDYAVYCPEDNPSASALATEPHHPFVPNQAREKWIKKRTSVKIKNGASNHRGNDIIVLEGRDQILHGRFSYGPFDMSVLNGEKVDIHVMKEPPIGEWTFLATVLTDKTGRITYKIPEKEKLGYGVYPVKMVVRGDHTLLAKQMAVVPSQTEAVIFSIDGSFTASVSVSGKDPKVRPSSVDVVRHWQDLGYLIIYVTGRPCMQLQKVVSWLTRHNFPQGLVSFADGFSTDPLGHKTEYLKHLQQEHSIVVHAGYGSSKDISVYSSIGLKPDSIHIVGKMSKKLISQCNHLSEGYAAHLTQLVSPGGSRPAQGNARMVIPRASGVTVPVIRQNSLRVNINKYNTLPSSAPAFPLPTLDQQINRPERNSFI